MRLVALQPEQQRLNTEAPAPRLNPQAHARAHCLKRELFEVQRARLEPAR